MDELISAFATQEFCSFFFTLNITPKEATLLAIAKFHKVFKLL